MENKTIAQHLKLLSQLMELHQQNPFKVKSVVNASFKIDKLPYKIADRSLEQIDAIDGIGKSISKKIEELLLIGSIQELEDLLAITPSGIIEMLGIKGIGPKKIAIIWHVLGIDNVGELYYACNENRLIEAKGFGEKTQLEIIKAIEFKMLNTGKRLYAKTITLNTEYYDLLNSFLSPNLTDEKVYEAGEFRRKCEVINQLVFVVSTHHPKEILEKIAKIPEIEILESTSEKIIFKDNQQAKIKVVVSLPTLAISKLFIETGSEEHVNQIGKLIDLNNHFDSEEAIYQKAGLSFIAPELREGNKEIELAKNDALPILINYSDLKGTLHNHSHWSDGVNTLEQMANYCKDFLGLQYLGISDHSKTAVYANGLSIERVLQQHEEIDSLNKKISSFKIFKGIESDILSDGSLDYPDEILARFDFVVASVHSNLKMDEEKATSRLIKAIENPYTTILGHPTGRLLLSRSGYPIDFKKVIDACAANKVIIEINANPLRLDLDWRWHQYALEKDVILSINPDAHRNEGFSDMEFGVYVARKGGLSKEKCLNAFSLDEISHYFSSKKMKK